jgi:hypothetical protein
MSDFTIAEVQRRLRRTRVALDKSDVLRRLPRRRGPHGAFLYDAAAVGAWERALIRHDGFAALLGRRPVRYLAQALSDLPPDHDGPCHACGRPAVRFSLRSWCPVCGIRNPEWIPP